MIRSIRKLLYLALLQDPVKAELSWLYLNSLGCDGVLSRTFPELRGNNLISTPKTLTNLTQYNTATSEPNTPEYIYTVKKKPAFK